MENVIQIHGLIRLHNYVIENTPEDISQTNDTLNNLSQSYYNVSTVNLSQTVWSVYNQVNGNNTGLQSLWDYAVSVSTVAWNAWNDCVNFTENFNNLNVTIGKTTNLTADNDNGIFGKLMAVSLVAHNAYYNDFYLTGQFNNLSTSYNNTSTIS